MESVTRLSALDKAINAALKDAPLIDGYTIEELAQKASSIPPWEKSRWILEKHNMDPTKALERRYAKVSALEKYVK